MQNRNLCRYAEHRIRERCFSGRDISHTETATAGDDEANNTLPSV